MSFTGDVEFVDGRPYSKTTTAVLRECLGCDEQAEEKKIGGFLEGLSIKPDAFFKDIDADWTGRPFIGQHVFKVVHAAGYGGTEDDLWLSVTGTTAPYALKGRAGQHRKLAAAKLLAEPKTAPHAEPKSRKNKPKSRRSPG